MPFAVKPNQTVLFIGDSITDCGRRDHAAPLGEGYVRQIRDLIAVKYPAHNLNIINKGISGNTVRDLFNRWTDDCIQHQPDWISIKIGINDIHRWLRKVEDQAVTAEEFADLYNQILTRVRKETKAKLVLVEPFYMSLDTKTDSFRSLVLEHLPSYMKTVTAMSRKYKTKIVHTHKAYQNILKHIDADQICGEPVHPNQSGHTVIAYEWLKTMGW
ncbi:MAG TPA: GDSL family lipase [Phycisphaerales bacterium]|nr:GDSL family lipase [Phycisphaerales bacterium]HCD32657.1 GDSL family lipase [Phycisphaerales bacterium]|tara:strand:+ start:246 stop:890 length:645 start_codon:yes stop_codon:yes gene_type:complete